VLFHPYFDLSYSSALIALNIPATLVPCERGRRYAGQSKMGVPRLIMHGLRMLMPFVDRLTTRALIGFGVVFGLGLAGSAVVLPVKLLTEWPIPGWMSFALLSIVTISLAGLVNLVILFVVSVQFRSLSMRGLHEKAFGLNEAPANGLGIINRQLLGTPADALLNYQSVNHSRSIVPKDGLRLNWEEFARLVKHRVRYLRFPAEHTENYNENVAPVDMLDALAHIFARYHLVATLKTGTRLFRVRIHNPAKVPKNTVGALGPPPVERARFSNRMSPAGMSMFYGALDETTARMETYVRHDGKPIAATIATFELVENLRVVDLTRLPDVPNAFASDEARLERAAILFLHAFVDDGFNQPIEKDGREHADYVPFQVVTEYLRYRLAETIGEPITGILYPSVRNKDGVGCVLFVAYEDIHAKTLRHEVPFQLLSDLTKTIPLAG
jgi:RES domain